MDRLRRLFARDIQSPFWLKLKGLLLLVAGVASSLLLFAEHPTVKVALLLAIAIWSFCRFYYFAFYVIERYVDARFRYSGIVAMLRSVVTARSRRTGRLGI